LVPVRIPVYVLVPVRIPVYVLGPVRVWNKYSESLNDGRDVIDRGYPDPDPDPDPDFGPYPNDRPNRILV